MYLNEKISVIIPTFNRANLLECSIQSVLEQTYDNLEVIIVDDGSADNTQEVVNAFQDNRIVYHKLSSNQGVSNARNAGVSVATASLVAFQDSDDRWRKDKLQKQMEYWRQHPEFQMIYTAYLYHAEGGEAFVVPSTKVKGDLEGDIFTDLLLRNTVGAPTILMKKECFLKSGGFDTSLKSLEDWEFAVRFAKDYEIGFVKEPLVDAYLSHGGVSSATGAYYESRCKMLAKYKKEMQEKGIFEQVTADILNRAQNSGVLEVVEKMLMIFLVNGY
ncbi:MAG: glycosyltransferase family 2 protein [Suilimivivens sp.]